VGVVSLAVFTAPPFPCGTAPHALDLRRVEHTIAVRIRRIKVPRQGIVICVDVHLSVPIAIHRPGSLGIYPLHARENLVSGQEAIFLGVKQEKRLGCPLVELYPVDPTVSIGVRTVYHGTPVEGFVGSGRRVHREEHTAQQQHRPAPRHRHSFPHEGAA